MRAFSVVHLRRSGGHAVISWLLRHYDDAVFSNSCRWKKPLRKLSAWRWRHGRKTDKDGLIRRSTRPFPEMLSDDIGLCGRAFEKEAWVVSYEDADTIDWDMEWDSAEFPIPGRHDRLLILRSFYNHIASRIAYSFTRSKVDPPGYHGQPDVDRWIAHARSRLFGSPVLYDKWFRSADYRAQLQDSFDLPRKDVDVNGIGPEGSGSSFSKTTMSGKAQEMPVLERWRDSRIVLPPEVLNNDEARELNHELFGWTLTKEGTLLN